MALILPKHHFLGNNPYYFPSPSQALDAYDGLLAIGGDLSIKRLLCAYEQGIFPWYSQDQPIAWYHPNPRMIITPQTLKISKSLQKILRSAQFDIKVNNDFLAVIRQCAYIKRQQVDKTEQVTGTWITDDMQKSYLELHKQGYAHSVEVYQNQQLVGGLYGVANPNWGKVFFGESMFSKVNNASKIALVHLLTKMPYGLVDCQVENPHLKSLGAFNISRLDFMQKLNNLKNL